MPLTVQVDASLKARQTGVADLGTPAIDVNVASQILFASGTASGQADRLFSDTRSLAGSTSENLDLAGSLTDAFGAALTFVKVRGIVIKAGAANNGDLIVGGAASNGFVGPFADVSDKIKIPAGGVFVLTAPAAGWTVTAATGDLLKIDNSGAGAGTYDIVIFGTSA